MTSSEEKLRGLQSEARQLRSSIKKYENLVEKYKKKVQSASRYTPETAEKREITLKLFHTSAFDLEVACSLDSDVHFYTLRTNL